jgi:hypothetical protein
MSELTMPGFAPDGLTARALVEQRLAACRPVEEKVPFTVAWARLEGAIADYRGQRRPCWQGDALARVAATAAAAVLTHEPDAGPRVALDALAIHAADVLQGRVVESHDGAYALLRVQLDMLWQTCMAVYTHGLAAPDDRYLQLTMRVGGAAWRALEDLGLCAPDPNPPGRPEEPAPPEPRSPILLPGDY